MKKTIKITIGIKASKEPDTRPVFLEGEKPGVFVTQEMDFDLTEEEYNSLRFAAQLMEYGDELAEKYVEIHFLEKKE